MPYDPLLLQPGDLRHPIEVQEASSSRDSFGQTSSTWIPVLTTRAKIESVTSLAYKELIQNNAIASQASDVVTIRWPGIGIDLEPGMRVVYKDNILLVQAVDNVLRRNRVVKLYCLVIDGDTN